MHHSRYLSHRSQELLPGTPSFCIHAVIIALRPCAGGSARRLTVNGVTALEAEAAALASDVTTRLREANACSTCNIATEVFAEAFAETFRREAAIAQANVSPSTDTRRQRVIELADEIFGDVAIATAPEVAEVCILAEVVHSHRPSTRATRQQTHLDPRLASSTFYPCSCNVPFSAYTHNAAVPQHMTLCCSGLDKIPPFPEDFCPEIGDGIRNFTIKTRHLTE